jgi:hypothetical protein
VTRLSHGRVATIENRCFGGPAVARIVGIFRRASDEELDRLLTDGQLARMAERLNDRELDRLIAELKAMQAAA